MRGGALACLLLAVAGGHVFGGQAEGRLNPPIEPARLTRIEPAGPGWSRVEGTVQRRRDCAFVRLEWRDPGGNRIDVIHIRAGRQRAERIFAFGPWRIQAPVDALQRTRAHGFFRCHALWLTEAVFYPGA